MSTPATVLINRRALELLLTYLDFMSRLACPMLSVCCARRVKVS